MAGPREEMDDVNRRVIEEFPANAGRVLTGRFAGSRLLLLTTHGRKSGPERVKPLMHVEDGERLVVFASKGGAPTNPDWYHNLLADALVVVEVGTRRFAARAEVAAAEERRRIWEDSLRLYPFLANRSPLGLMLHNPSRKEGPTRVQRTSLANQPRNHPPQREPGPEREAVGGDASQWRARAQAVAA